MSDTAALVPLTLPLALYGLFDVNLPDRLEVSTRLVATVNNATLATAHKHVYSPLQDFIWAKADGHLGHTRDLPEPEGLQE
jgi:hypothetical protein